MLDNIAQYNDPGHPELPLGVRLEERGVGLNGLASYMESTHCYLRKGEISWQIFYLKNVMNF